MASLAQLLVAGIAAAGLGNAAPVAKQYNTYAVRQWVEKSGQTIEWGPCSEQFSTNLTCATFTVPLDWNCASETKTVELGLVRAEAQDKANRIGYLFLNPGGPGGQASSTVSSYASGRFDPQIRDRFDVIGLDPRGVGLSTPVQCDIEAINKRVKFQPKTDEEFDALVQYNKDLAASCIEKTGSLINFVDTISAVKDHEAVRLALGGDKATFLGLSYGTQLFSQYAQLFPDGIRAIALDGNLQRSQSESSNILIESTAVEATLGQFFEWCVSTDECVLQDKDAESVFKSVREKATESPIPAPGCDDKVCRTDVTEEDFLFVTQSYMISTRSWPGFAQALVAANNGNATLISQNNPLAIGDAYEDSYLFAGTAIACQDWAHASTELADLTEKEQLGLTFSPHVHGFCQSYKIQTSCIGWPAPLSNVPAPIVYKGDVTMLQVNSLYDPSTSYTWALGLQSEIKNTVLLTRNGSGHTSYGLGGETTKLTNAYLLNMTLPAPGTITST
ncbi:hypothetical protein F4808DRAFT_66193 [Astrocystis sublimbata]|nr:hypothetical protein F4808DRAFT_66193 [Astrocystis sublimbata]